MDNTKEMYLLSKFKYLRRTFTTVTKSAKELREEELRKKAEKKAKMAEACKPGQKQQDKSKHKEKVVFQNKTPHGEKKDMSLPMEENYDPAAVESAWDAWWNSKNYFTADVEKAKNLPREKRYIMILPPPNVTGSLHLGHTLMCSIQDSLVRWRRMKGYSVVWVPGTDHAGIATQSVVEKKLLKEEKKTRHDYGREKFLEKVWEWKNVYGNRILMQCRRLGVSFDWNRLYFTLDDARSKAVVEAFIRLHERGILYRAERIVHWCCALRTAISDVEIDEKELTGPEKLKIPLHNGEYEFGVLIDFAYKLKEDPNQEIVVSTTRIETMLGDVAVAVHPDDNRYKHLIGKELVHPFIKDRKMIIVADPVLVNMEFGTGAVKITPAHDPNDFLCGQRHNLPLVTILDDDGKINHNGGEYQGLRRYDCRNKILSDLEKLGLFRGKKPNPMVLGICSKSGDVIEPLVKPQWWVNCKDVAKRTIDDVNSGKLKILPESHKAKLFEFLNNIRDWCVSRQLWWGHRCPVYLVKIKGKREYPDINNNDHWIAAKSEDEALMKALLKHPEETKDTITLTQDEDVLDTWFSSALLPFSVFDWPNVDSEDLKTFFPTDLLETGHDILFFWVARMVFMSYFFLDTLPYHTVFLHPLVRDAQGRKMSKSLGNIIDPLEVIDGLSLEKIIENLSSGNLPKEELLKSIEERKKEFPNGIPDCGADALRFGLLSYTAQGRNINMNIMNIINYRFFCNKLWNVTRFCLLHIPKGFKYVKDIKSLKLSLVDQWILSKLSQTIRIFDENFEKYNFGAASSQLYSFWLYNFCDIYVEAIKSVMRSNDEDAKIAAQNTLYYCMDRAIRLMHPLMPFLSEELYQRLPHPDENKFESVCIAEFPTEIFWENSSIDKKIEIIVEISKSISSILTSFKVEKKKPNICIYSNNEITTLVSEQKQLISTISRAGEVFVTNDKNDVKFKSWLRSVVNAESDVFLDIKSLIDISKEIERIQNTLNEKLEYKNEILKKINTPMYETKVKEDVKVANAEKLKNVSIEIEKIEESLKVLKEIN